MLKTLIIATVLLPRLAIAQQPQRLLQPRQPGQWCPGAGWRSTSIKSILLSTRQAKHCMTAPVSLPAQTGARPPDALCLSFEEVRARVASSQAAPPSSHVQFRSADIGTALACTRCGTRSRMRTSFHHQPQAQHPNFQLSTSWSADYPIFRGQIGKHLLVPSLPLLNPQLTTEVEATSILPLLEREDCTPMAWY